MHICRFDDDRLGSLVFSNGEVVCKCLIELARPKNFGL